MRVLLLLYSVERVGISFVWWSTVSSLNSITNVEIFLRPTMYYLLKWYVICDGCSQHVSCVWKCTQVPRRYEFNLRPYTSGTCEWLCCVLVAELCPAACGYKIDEAHEAKWKNISGIYVKFLVFNIYGSWWCMCRSAPQTYYSRSAAYENVPVLRWVPVADYSSLTHIKETWHCERAIYILEMIQDEFAWWQRQESRQCLSGNLHAWNLHFIWM